MGVGVLSRSLTEADITNLSPDLAARLVNPMTAVDDLIVAAALGAPGRLPIGAAGSTLRVSNLSGHVSWSKIAARTIAVDDNGADPTGAASSDAAFATTRAQLAALGGGRMKLTEGGTYLCQSVGGAGYSNIWIDGGSSKLTTIMAASPFNNVATLNMTGTSNWRITGLKIVGRGVGGTVREVGFQVTDCTDFDVDDVWVTEQRGMGMLWGGAHTAGAGNLRFTFRNLAATNIHVNPTGTEGGGVWLYKDCEDFRGQGIYTDMTDSEGLLVDAGTNGTGQVGYPPIWSVISDVLVKRSGRNGTGVGCSLDGAQRLVINGIIVTDTSASSSVWRGLQFDEDQTGIPCSDVIVLGYQAIGIAGEPVEFNRAQRCYVEVRAHNIGMNATSQTIAGVRFQGSQATPGDLTDYLDGVTLYDNLDNTVVLEVVQDAGVGKYDTAVLFDTSYSQSLRNRVILRNFSAPADRVITTIGTPPPFTGADANVLEGIGPPQGDGSDGVITLQQTTAAPAWATKSGSGATTTFTLTRDLYGTLIDFDDAAGAFLVKTAGFRVYFRLQWVIDAGVTVHNDGAAAAVGVAGGNAASGTIGNATGAGSNGGAGVNGAQAAAITQSAATANVSATAHGGAGGGTTAGTGNGAAGGTAFLSAASGSPRNLNQLYSWLGSQTTVSFRGGGGGTGGSADAGATGGGGGGGGGCLAAYGAALVNKGTIRCAGGAGAAGTIGTGTAAGGGGGGGGGAVGIVYGVALGAGTITAPGGAGGAHAGNGGDGASGQPGIVYLHPLVH